MIEHGKISAAQLSIIMVPTVLATSILSVPSITMTYAGQDMWLSPIWASILGLMSMWVAFGLSKLYPKSTLIESSVLILGKWGGKLFGLLYLLFLPHITGVIIRQYGEFIVRSALPQTPLFAIVVSMVLVCAINVRSGIEVVGRTAQIFVAIFILFAAFLFVLLIRDLHPEQILPIGEAGLLPSLRGSVAPGAWFTEYILLAFLLPYVHDRHKALHKSLLSILAVTLSMVITNFVCLFLMGDLTDSFQYPVMIAARYISIADFMQHLEAIVIAIWIAGIFVKISIFIYVFTLSTAEWLELKAYRSLVLPLSFVCVIFTYWVATSQTDIVKLYGTSANVYTIVLLLVMPSLLLLTGAIKNKWFKRRSA
ncbi:GerAB/ArcD/ProY family transporter [Paenibacillus sinopodophylli]|uniref:GerAB/ArcD/ProY family transporter n=1 Tax=Paenibacillus sinopodophylli TaxID=1837342 RepID=UPI0014869803|nr:endospore germination permease [Paenibacillus sinopodophylli]